MGSFADYRSDFGAQFRLADELFDFLITQQEVNHIFDNYRRDRQTFSVRNASNRTLSRYNEKLRDAAKGMGIIANIYKDFSVAQGYDYDTLWPFLGADLFGDNIGNCIGKTVQLEAVPMLVAGKHTLPVRIFPAPQPAPTQPATLAAESQPAS